MPLDKNGKYITETQFITKMRYEGKYFEGIGPLGWNGPTGNTTDCHQPFSIPLGIFFALALLLTYCYKRFGKCREIVHHFTADEGGVNDETDNVLCGTAHRSTRGGLYWMLVYTPTTIVAFYQLFQVLQSFGVFNSANVWTDWSFETPPRCIPLFSSIRTLILAFPSSMAHYRLKDGIASARLCTDAPASFVSRDDILAQAVIDPFDFNNCSRREIADNCILSAQYYPGDDFAKCSKLLQSPPLPNGWAYRHIIEEYPSSGCKFLFNRMKSEDFDECKLAHVHIFSANANSFDGTLKFIVVAWVCVLGLQVFISILPFLVYGCSNYFCDTVCKCSLCNEDRRNNCSRWLCYYASLFNHVWSGGMCFCYGDTNNEDCIIGCEIPSGKDVFFFRRTLPLPLLLLCRVRELIETIGFPFVLIGNCPVCQFPVTFTFLIFKSLILIKDLVNTFSLARSFNRISPDNVDEVATNSTTVEMSATQTNATCVTRKYSSPQPIHSMVDRQCPNGHQLQVVNGKPATYPDWFCDLCGNNIHHDSFGVLHCPACQFDLCCGCQAQNFR
jgi:hypothetical protein